MYLPKHFEERDPGRLRSFVQRYPLGSLVTATGSGLDANHIPFVFADTGSAVGTLHGHVARANPLLREGVRDRAALVIFQGPNSFISPSWYPSKRENARVVPTWNYAVVHVHGVLRFVDDPAWVRSHVEALTREHEAERDPPWAVTDAPADFVDKMVAAVVGIEISITELVGKWKVSQNRSVADRVAVADALEREATPAGAAIAELMRETLDAAIE
jgi:transcriptional regulator